MLDFGNSNSRQSNAPRKKTGVFISEATIKSVSVKYDIQEEWQKRPDDIALYLDLDIGRDFDHQMRIGGYFNRNDDGTIKNWGAALKVKILLDSLGIEGQLTDEHQLPDEVIEDMVGKKFLRLSYVAGIKKNGKTLWVDWNEVGKVGQEDRLREKFMKSVNDGWVKNYKPDTQEDNSSQNNEDVKSFVL